MTLAINPEGMQLKGLSQALRSGPWLVLSGQVAIKDGEVVSKDDPYQQAVQCFDNIRRIVYEAGSQVSEIVMLRCYLTDKSHYKDYARAKSEAMGDRAPASTAVVVKELLLDGLLLEVEALVYMDD